MIQQIEFRLAAKRRGCHLITGDIMRQLPQLPATGLLNVFVKHTSCGLTINENADPDVRTDLDNILDHLVPEVISNECFTHNPYHKSSSQPRHVAGNLSL